MIDERPAGDEPTGGPGADAGSDQGGSGDRPAQDPLPIVTPSQLGEFEIREGEGDIRRSGADD